MLNGRTISIKQLIGEVYRDQRYTYELPWTDAIEWAVDAIELIGAPTSLSPKISKITIENYRGMLPCDLNEISQAAGSYSGCSIFPMTEKTDSFHPVFTCDNQLLSTLISEYNTTTSITTPIGEDISGNPVYTFQNGNMSLPETTSDNVDNTNTSYSTYNVNDNYIFTSFKDGFVFLAYKGLPVDDEGFPTIPDNRRFKEAIKAYIVSKIDYILYRRKELDKNIYEHSEREWLWYCGSAGNIARMPGVDGMQSLLNQMKLIPQKYSHNNFFKTLGS